MKPLTTVGIVLTLAVFQAGCTSVSSIDSRLKNFNLDAETYIVRAGETLDSIAFRYQIPKTRLVALNPGVQSQLRVGTPLVIRRNPSTQVSRAPSSAYPAVNSVTRQPKQAVVAVPVEVPQAVRSENTVAYPPSVTAIVSDPVLMAKADSSLITAPREGPVEIIEEVYVHDGPVQQLSRLSQVQVEQQLQSMVGPWVWPTEGQVARGFAPQTQGRHGVDIAGVPGQQVVAALDGTVLFTGKDPSGAGNIVIVKHEDDLLTAYSHTQDLYVAENDSVRAGDPIASLGANEQQESVLRFEVRRNGNPLNPMDFLQAR